MLYHLPYRYNVGEKQHKSDQKREPGPVKSFQHDQQQRQEQSSSEQNFREVVNPQVQTANLGARSCVVHYTAGFAS